MRSIGPTGPTFTGVRLAVVVPLPSWPQPLWPQHFAVRSMNSAQVWRSPPAIEVAPAMVTRPENDPP